MNDRKYLRILAGILLLTGVLGCTITDRLRTKPAGPAGQSVAGLPTRTAWPTFTVVIPETPTPLPTSTPTLTPSPIPTDTPAPTETPLPTETPEPTNTPRPAAPAPEPTQPPADQPPADQPAPQWQYEPTGFEGQWNGGLAQIRGKIKDVNGNPVQGTYVQAKCGGTTLASGPSGINMYAPSEPYEAGAYDIILSSPLSKDSMCRWEVRIVAANTYEEAKNPGAASLSDTAYCDLKWDESSICFATWRKNW